MRYALRVLFLTSVWVLLWGSLSIANLLSGVAVATLLLLVYPDPRVRHEAPLGRPRPLAMARLMIHVVGQLVASNLVVSKEIVTRGSDIRAGVVACQLRARSERMITFIANVLSLSPGTMPVEVSSDPPVIYIHVLHLSDPVEARRRVARLEHLAVSAFGSADDLARVGRQAHVHRRSDR